MSEEIRNNSLIPPRLDLSVDRYAAWRVWKQKWEDYSLLTDMGAKPAEFRCQCSDIPLQMKQETYTNP